MTKVCIVQRRLTHYRVPFFEALRVQLAAHDIQLELLVGRGTPEEERKDDRGVLPWAVSLPTHYLAGGRLCWQPFKTHLANASVVIITQENKLIQNHLLMITPRDFKLAFWGHGANLQSANPLGMRERFKRWTTNQVDWWFGYTAMSSPLIERAKFPRERITILNNSIDTTEMASMRQNVTPVALQQLKTELGLQGDQVGVFVGSLYGDKRIDFMLEAVGAIRARIPNFEFLIVGAGPQQALVESFCQQNKWAKYLGVRKGQAKVDAMALAKIMINPGAVGLSVLDSFVCGVPLTTTDCSIHGPEIAYVNNGVNGLITGNTVEQYAAGTVALLLDRTTLNNLKAACAACVKTYTIENMARNFADGVLGCLAAPVYRRGRGS